MFVTNGEIKDLIKWYLSETGKKYKAVCFLITSNLKDEELLSMIYDKRFAFDTITGEAIAFFLFSDSINEAIEIRTDQSNSKGIILPGKNLSQDNSIFTTEIKDIHDPKIKENITKRSQTISSELKKYFNINTNDIPCLVFLQQEDNEVVYQVLPTYGEENIKHLFNIFKEINQLRDIALIKEGSIKENKKKIKSHEEIILERNLKKEELISNIESYKMDTVKRKRESRKLSKVNFRLQKLQTKLANYRDSIKKQMGFIDNYDDEVEKIIMKYENKFFRLSKVRPIIDFFSKTAQSTKKMNSFLTLEDKFDKFMEK